MNTKTYFPSIGKINFEGKESKNPLAFRYYNPDKVVYGRKMKDWFKFSMAYWHTLCSESSDPFGGNTKSFDWNKATDPVQAAKDKLDAGFEFMQKLALSITVSMILIWLTKVILLKHMKPT